MPAMNRRESLKLLLGGLLHTAGTVVLAGAVLPARAGQIQPMSPGEDFVKDLQQRADQLADAQGAVAEEGCDPGEFANGGFRNAAFRNTGGGGSAGAAGFRNAATGGGGAAGAFRNAATGGSAGAAGFRNGGFANGGGGAAAFRNGGFTNGGWRN